MDRCYLFVVVFLVSSRPLMADGLQEGQWSGVYTSYHGSSLNAEYHVSKIKENDKNIINIKMVLDLQPRAKYTYELKNIRLEDKKLTFNIKKENETKTCELEKQDNDQYVGLCKSDVDPDPEGKWLASILMTPPSNLGLPQE